MDENLIIKKTIELLGCDTARISQPNKHFYMIIGYNRNTISDEGSWEKNGVPIDFDYTKEKIIARGSTLMKLWNSVEHYNKTEQNNG